MAGARHDTDEYQGESDMQYSFGPSVSSLIERAKATRATRQDDKDGPGMRMWREPKPGKELDFN